jgi:hypothetical protein
MKALVQRAVPKPRRVEPAEKSAQTRDLAQTAGLVRVRRLPPPGRRPSGREIDIGWLRPTRYKVH